MTERLRGRLFVMLCMACTAIAVGYVLLRTGSGRHPAADTDAVPERAPLLSSAAFRASSRETTMYFRNDELGPQYGKLAKIRLPAATGAPMLAALSCDRVYFAGGRGVCLSSERGVFTTYEAVSFDADMRPGWHIRLNGEPSRVRVSPGGTYAAMTVFVFGHSYASTSFSTETTIVDAATGRILASLEDFSVSDRGATVREADFNFWGVTFGRDENQFFATLGTGERTRLVEGDLRTRQVRVIHEDVECPSLSPDNARIAFKRRIGPATWRIYLLDLGTMQERPLNEMRSVDDQVEWLDDATLVYALPPIPGASSAGTDLWMLPITETAKPTLLKRAAFSPAFTHGSADRDTR